MTTMMMNMMIIMTTISLMTKLGREIDFAPFGELAFKKRAKEVACLLLRGNMLV